MSTAWWDNSNARRFGYKPQGKSADFLHQAMAAQAKLPADPIGDRFQGGPSPARNTTPTQALSAIEMPPRGAMVESVLPR